MPAFLRQSTASQIVELGPFLDDTDFKTAETALTIANTDIKLRKAGGTTHVSKNSGGGTHIANGYYQATFDATDTNTVGILDVHVNVAGALALFDRYVVLEEAVYDQLMAAGAAGAPTPPTVAAIADAVWEEPTSDHADAGTKGGDSLLSDVFVDAPVSTRAATGEAAGAIAAVGLTSTVTGRIDAAVSSRLATAGYTAPPTTAQIAAAVFDLSIGGHVNNGSFGKYLVDGSVSATVNSADITLLKELLQSQVILKGNVGSETPSTNTLIFIGGTPNPVVTFGNDELVDHLMVLRDTVQGEYHARWITAYNSATKVATLASALPFTPTVGQDQYWILAHRKDPNVGLIKLVTDLLPAAKLTAHAASVLVITVGNGSTSVAVKLATVDGGAPSAIDDFYNGAVIVFTSGALAGQRCAITDYVGATTTATITAATSAPANGVTGVIA